MCAVPKLNATSPTRVMSSMVQSLKLKSHHPSQPHQNSKQNQSQYDDCMVETEAVVEKGVTFSPMVSVRQTISRSDYSSEERSMYWFSSEEFNEISMQCAKQIAKLDRGEKLNGKKYCTRGLEGHTETRAVERIQAKQLARDTVLDEQDNQFCEGIRDEEAIAQLYRAVSSSSQSWAQMVALCDERAVKKMMK